jgi:anthranilate 1,2-dioxygenase (deaminating, decarboxylating) large subunit
LLGLALLAMASAIPAPAFAFNERPLNLGATSIYDGGGAPPGLIWMPYVQFVDASKALDKDGKTIPGGGTFTALSYLNQFFYLSPLKFAGAFVGFNVIVPAAVTSAKGMIGPMPVTANTGGIGDPTFGAALQWNDTKLFGAPFFHRAEVDVFAPWGKYDQNYMINPGQNFTTVEGYYAFTMFLSQKLETSWRLHYTWNGENPATKVQAGPLFHVNYDASYEVLPKFRVGAAGYILQQLADDKLGGASLPDSEERVFGVGPVLGYITPGFMALVTHQEELGVRNRFQDSQTTLQIIYKF